MNFSHLRKRYLHKRGMESGPRYIEANNQTNEAPQKSVKYQINFSTFIVLYRKIVTEKNTDFHFFMLLFHFSFNPMKKKKEDMVTVEGENQI